MWLCASQHNMLAFRSASGLPDFKKVSRRVSLILSSSAVLEKKTTNHLLFPSFILFGHGRVWSFFFRSQISVYRNGVRPQSSFRSPASSDGSGLTTKMGGNVEQVSVSASFYVIDKVNVKKETLYRTFPNHVGLFRAQRESSYRALVQDRRISVILV